MIEFSVELRRRVNELSLVRNGVALKWILLDWIAIFAIAHLFCAYLPIAFWPLAVPLIAGRQHALLILMHDAAHYRIHSSHKWNDRISNWFLAYPLFVTTEGFRADHLPHHKDLFTDLDPEWKRKSLLPEWKFPQTHRRFYELLLRDMLGLNVFLMFRMLKNFSSKTPTQTRRTYLRPIYYLSTLVLIVSTNLVLEYLVFWILPAFTVLFGILRVRNVAEHSGVERSNDLRNARNILRPSLWEKWVFGPHSVGLHLDHHLFPSVPFYNLRALHTELSRVPEYQAQANQCDRYFGDKDSVMSEVLITGKVGDER